MIIMADIKHGRGKKGKGHTLLQRSKKSFRKKGLVPADRRTGVKGWCSPCSGYMEQMMAGTTE